MPFAVRNVVYLRVSATSILATTLYLDQRHVAWMNANPRIWDRAVEEMLKPKLCARSARDPSCPAQVCENGEFKLLFYFQSTDMAHNVLLKTKTLQFPDAEAPVSNIPCVKQEPDDALFIPDSEDEDLYEKEAKPHVRVQYKGFTVCAQQLVCVLEPTEATMSKHPTLFTIEDDASRNETRQLDTARPRWDLSANPVHGRVYKARAARRPCSVE
ncbi:hypothetical protein MVES_000738 [Malassezia vespertilionis]|uniref:Uncharacterized protein n=1 Tax=Malassezia vespertilionis TaxID=2020962 RepID=A0A2N1JGP2_9BASI|nr:hypothetical protein MVES_000738 [Malassezia vespertilionis]